MQKSVTGLVVLALAGTAGLAQAQSAGDKGEFKTLIQHYWEAWSTLNPDTAAPMYTKDTDAVFFDVAPLKYNGWDQYKEGVQKVFATAARASFAPNDDLKVVRRGNTAWTSNTFHGTVTQKDGKTMQLEGRQTTIWEKLGGHWIIVHEHVSVPMS